MVFKCKMCGASLDVAGKEALVKCKYCGSVQTVPKLNEDVRANLYDRANYFLRNNEYDIALLIYQQILNDDTTDAEAYFSIALCRYGVQYVKDPSTKIMTPTINRIQYASFFKDQDYLLCLQYADEERKKYY